jgi:hypothetical protein
MLPILEQRMNIPMSRVLAFALWANVPFPTLKPVVGVKVLQIGNVWPTDFGGGIDEVVLRDGGSQRAIGYLNGAIVAMDAIRILAMIRLELCKSVAEQKKCINFRTHLVSVWQQLIRPPTRRFPGFKVGTLRPSVHHKVYR